MVGSSASVETETSPNATTRPRYPPCVSDFCTSPLCCAQGYKYQWPKLVGKSKQQAKAVIEKDNPLVRVVVLPPGAIGLGDFCCNRVYLYVDRNGKTISVPRVG
ncbi:hypothetical protein FH972_005539 [Carpinus fangiana]|uniref:Proteinase inhibitor I13 n=1 Tax=Carpinus fangiana TaxID=176857 RepID=A0A5N6QPK8_9ROSI|nr:hypothetical protein FH972_005539 [Carpinus fangiana]